MKEKNKRTNTGLGRPQAPEGRSLCDNFVQLSEHLQAIVGVYFARNFYKATKNTDIFSCCLTRSLLVNRSEQSPFWLLLTLFSALPPSSDCLLLPTVSFPGLPYQAGWSLLPSVVNSILSVFPGIFLFSSTSGLAGDLTIKPYDGFRARADKEILWPAPTQTKMNVTYFVTHRRMNKSEIFILIWENSEMFQKEYGYSTMSCAHVCESQKRVKKGRNERKSAGHVFGRLSHKIWACRKTDGPRCSENPEILGR